MAEFKYFRVSRQGNKALVVFDSDGRMNTLSAAVILELLRVIARINEWHQLSSLKAVVLVGNANGFGAGANIGELMHADATNLTTLLENGHQALYAIEQSEVPWIAVVTKQALGGMYELALACRAIIIVKKAKVGFPEILLNIFPGLGGMRRIAERVGLVNSRDPVNGVGAYSLVLEGRILDADEALAIGAVDRVCPEDDDPIAFAETFIDEELDGFVRPTVSEEALRQGAALKSVVLGKVKKATRGRNHPRAPYVALDLLVAGATKSRTDAIAAEAAPFIELATSHEGRAGMRTFFSKQEAEKPDKNWPRARKIGKVGVAGGDGFMGNAIAFLALRAGYNVVVWVHDIVLAEAVFTKLKQKYEVLVRKNKLTQDQADEEISNRLTVVSNLAEFHDCSLVIEAISENRAIKAEFWKNLGGVVGLECIVGSNSSSMGPSVLAPYFIEGGGSASQFINFHFFSPAELPIMALVELIRHDDASYEAVATAHAFCRRIKKTPIVLRDGSAGFLVNAALAAYFRAAEFLYRTGLSIVRIDNALRDIFPMGAFQMADMAGLDVAAGMFNNMTTEQRGEGQPLICLLADQSRSGIKSGGGFYDYSTAGGPTGAWDGLDALVERTDESAEFTDPQIVDHCARAIYMVSSDLVSRGIVGSRELADLAFILGIGFAPDWGGPIFYGQEHGWSGAAA